MRESKWWKEMFLVDFGEVVQKNAKKIYKGGTDRGVRFRIM